jgi:hypothetical protein
MDDGGLSQARGADRQPAWSAGWQPNATRYIPVVGTCINRGVDPLVLGSPLGTTPLSACSYPTRRWPRCSRCGTGASRADPGVCPTTSAAFPLVGKTSGIGLPSCPTFAERPGVDVRGWQGYRGDGPGGVAQWSQTADRQSSGRSVSGDLRGVRDCGASGGAGAVRARRANPSPSSRNAGSYMSIVY